MRPLALIVLIAAGLASSSGACFDPALDGLACSASGSCPPRFECLDGRCEPCPEVCLAGEDACAFVCTRCGDGIVSGEEECDPGAVGVETASCDYDCTVAVCGDRYVNTTAGERCDDGNSSPNDLCVACNPAYCGDGVLRLGGTEECDDGNAARDDNCVSCRWARCGDGVTDRADPGIEGCDDGNQVDTDACRNDCTLP